MNYRLLRLVAIVAAVAATALGINASGPANFKPDGMVTGSTLAGWHVLGGADWKAARPTPRANSSPAAAATK